MLNRIKIPWTWLERHLNRVIDEVNVNKPLASASIAIEQSPNGTILRIVGKGDDSQKQSSGGNQQQQFIRITVINWYGVKWQPVTVVDPGTCAQSSLTVLTKTGNNNDFISIGTSPLAGFPS